MASWLHHWLYQDFWVLIWPNAGAVPLCAVVGFIGAWLFRDRIGRAFVAWFHKHHTAHLAQLEEREREGQILAAMVAERAGKAELAVLASR